MSKSVTEQSMGDASIIQVATQVGAAAACQAPGDGPQNKRDISAGNSRRRATLLKALLIALLSLVLLGIAAYMQRTPILRRAGNFLVATDPLEQADILYLLNGDFKTRPYRAAELFHAGMAPKIVIPWVQDKIEGSGAIWNASEVNRTALRMSGVPDAQVEEFHFSPGITSTFDEAQALLSYAKSHSVHKVIVVTSDWHSRRTRWIMRRLLFPSGIQVMVAAAASPPLVDKTSHRNEYLKLFYYWLKY